MGFSFFRYWYLVALCCTGVLILEGVLTTCADVMGCAETWWFLTNALKDFDHWVGAFRGTRISFFGFRF